MMLYMRLWKNHYNRSYIPSLGPLPNNCDNIYMCVYCCGYSNVLWTLYRYSYHDICNILPYIVILIKNHSLFLSRTFWKCQFWYCTLDKSYEWHCCFILFCQTFFYKFIFYRHVIRFLVIFPFWIEIFVLEACIIYNICLLVQGIIFKYLCNYPIDKQINS